MAASSSKNDPTTTYTLDQFISMQITDDMTYYNFSIIEVVGDVQHLDRNIVEEYLDILKDESVTVELSNAEVNRYSYYPDLLAYDLYGSVQLDFVILLLNDMIDPKEFTKNKVVLPYASGLSSFLNQVYAKESDYIELNRYNNNILT